MAVKNRLRRGGAGSGGEGDPDRMVYPSPWAPTTRLRQPGVYSTEADPYSGGSFFRIPGVVPSRPATDAFLTRRVDMTEPKILRGTLDLLILTAVSVAPIHGYGIGQWIQSHSHGELEVDEGALYHALHRLHRKGHLEAEWKPSDTGRRAKFYTLTGRGREYLATEEARWVRYSDLVGRLVRAGKAD